MAEVSDEGAYALRIPRVQWFPAWRIKEGVPGYVEEPTR